MIPMHFGKPVSLLRDSRRNLLLYLNNRVPQSWRLPEGLLRGAGVGHAELSGTRWKSDSLLGKDFEQVRPSTDGCRYSGT
jgi:hypothetical protein